MRMEGEEQSAQEQSAPFSAPQAIAGNPSERSASSIATISDSVDEWEVHVCLIERALSGMKVYVNPWRGYIVPPVFCVCGVPKEPVLG